ncbi:hypothetical protein Cgig2_017155 [Carnegiea gigantea]|uniref:Uncharacterized protein n=1 Tax=Carnegiea gigantea TaxID=171969 RepID=A0A9Q1JGH0_9CARY|nr:hypothetical protein Cgig2_017155 [Carnegiea gigantea]
MYLRRNFLAFGSKENDLTHECEEITCDEDQVKRKEEATIHQIVKVARKRNKPLLRSDDGQGVKGKHVQVRSMGFASFLMVDLKQILGKFSKWLVESSNPYVVCFRLSDGQKYQVTTFNVYVILGVHSDGRQIVEITKSSMDEEYDKNTPELTRMLEFILAKKDRGESFKMNFVIYLISEPLLQQVCAEIYERYELDHIHRLVPPKQQPNKDNGFLSFSPTAAVREPNTTSVVDASVSVGKEEHHGNVLMDQAKKEMNKDDILPSFSLG